MLAGENLLATDTIYVYINNSIFKVEFRNMTTNQGGILKGVLASFS